MQKLTIVPVKKFQMKQLKLAFFCILFKYDCAILLYYN
jgi:hypothetical protein